MHLEEQEGVSQEGTFFFFFCLETAFANILRHERLVPVQGSSSIFISLGYGVGGK